MLLRVPATFSLENGIGTKMASQAAHQHRIQNFGHVLDEVLTIVQKPHNIGAASVERGPWCACKDWTVRITGGIARGLSLFAPPLSQVRPTSDRVRGALFQLVGEAVSDASVLDLYAGTGALGIEALSRGAARADFVEQDVRLCHAIRRNLENAGFADRGRVCRVRVEQALAFLKGPYRLVLVDPPYDLPGIPRILEALNRPSLLEEGGVVVVEHSRRVALPGGYGALRRGQQRRYGDTMLSVYSKGET